MFTGLKSYFYLSKVYWYSIIQSFRFAKSIFSLFHMSTRFKHSQLWKLKCTKLMMKILLTIFEPRFTISTYHAVTYFTLMKIEVSKLTTLHRLILLSTQPPLDKIKVLNRNLSGIYDIKMEFQFSYTVRK